MPKDIIDYSNTIIYKIYCKDETIKDTYIGHTTNFSQRKYSHKIACNNIKESSFKIYKVIQQHGGWDNWDMVEIAKYNCKDSVEARIKEYNHYLLENSTLNAVPPYIDKINYYCNTCKKQYNHKRDYEKHLESETHKIWADTVIPPKDDKKSLKYFCEKCIYNTDNKKDYRRHLLTAKHIKITKKDTNDDILPKNTQTFSCSCGNKYKHRQGLWKHQKKCDIVNEEIVEDKPTTVSSESELKILTNLVLDVVKQNKELINQNQELTNKIVDICKTGVQSNNISNSNINSNNKTFNLQFFLNETCKNAMNLTDFVNSLQLQLSDLENVGKLGYVDGISSIIVKNLNALDETTRPIHCTDKKRETFYVKDEDKWEKDDNEKKKIKKVINKVAFKNQNLLSKFKELHPGCNFSESKYADQYSKLVIEAMGGLGDNHKEKEDKIIRKIANEVTISKQKGMECID
jgi:hypothetical protein